MCVLHRLDDFGRPRSRARDGRLADAKGASRVHGNALEARGGDASAAASSVGGVATGRLRSTASCVGVAPTPRTCREHVEAPWRLQGASDLMTARGGGMVAAPSPGFFLGYREADAARTAGLVSDGPPGAASAARSDRPAARRTCGSERGFEVSVNARVRGRARVVLLRRRSVGGHRGRGGFEGDFQVVRMPLRGEIRSAAGPGAPRRWSGSRAPGATPGLRGEGDGGVSVCAPAVGGSRDAERARAVRSPRHPNVLFGCGSRVFSLFETATHLEPSCSPRVSRRRRRADRASDRCGRRSVGSAGGASRAGARDCARGCWHLPGRISKFV